MNQSKKIATAIIFYTLDGLHKSWSVGYRCGVDDNESLKKHLAHWIPKAKFIRVEFMPDKPAIRHEWRLY